MKTRITLVFTFLAVALTLMFSNFGISGSAKKQNTTTRKTESPQRLQPGTTVFEAEVRRYEGDGLESDADPDRSTKVGGLMEKDDYLELRNEYFARLRGVVPGEVFDGQQRVRAISEMNDQESQIRAEVDKAKATGLHPEGVFPNWTAIGPQPLPNGQLVVGGPGPTSGRATAVATDTTNNIIYLGAAQGGVWRSADGGTTWTAIMDTAASLSIGALAIAPSSPTTLYVGTGETNNCVDCYFGVGIYRIDNANSASPTIVGPINPNFTFAPSGGGGPVTTTVFGNVGISKILVHSTDPATIFVSTKTSTSGATEANFSNWPSQFIPPMAVVGVWRSTNATAAAGSVAFTKLAVPTAASASVDTPATGNRSITDMIMEPGVPDNVIVYAFGANAAGDGGVWRSTNATTTGTFTQVKIAGSTRWTFAIHKVGAAVTVYAATTEGFTNIGCNSATTRFGTLRRSIDGGATWNNVLAGAAGTAGIIQSAAGFCEPQCSYDITVAVDPNNVNNIYLGGSAPGYTPCSHAVARSTDGVAFAADETGVHADTHYIFSDQTGTNIYDANDGGIWKRTVTAVAASAWVNVNNSPLNTLQFQSVAVHPTDANFTLGGTQDNGTEWQSSVSGTWLGAEGGDGGYALIDTNSAGTAVTQYHTFYCAANSQIFFDRATSTTCNTIKDSWPTRGPAACSATTLCSNDATPAPCDGTQFYIGNNGIQLYDNVLFYPPMALGPGNPNTLYFGTDRLYRSTNKGDSMSIVSQSPIVVTGTRVPITGGAAQNVGSIITAVGVAPSDDNVRMVGLLNGNVWATSTGSSTLVNISPTLPAHPVAGQSQYIGHAVINPSNPNVAYISLAYYTPAGQGIFRITNLQAASNGAPVAAAWTASSNGIPSIPINALAIDPAKPYRVFAGTDMGVYISEDAGANWSPYGQGLPRVAVFDMAIQPSSRILRVATHGRGMWEIGLQAPTAAPANILGRVITADGQPLAGVTLNLSGGRSANAITDSNGNYRFSNVDTDSFYTVTPSLTNYHFGPESRSFSLVANKTDAVFTAARDAVIVGNAIDSEGFFVRQHYLDFLGREPDESGFNFWTDQVRTCGVDSACAERRLINVSAAYFLSIEFQQTGGLVDGLYRASYGRQPLFAEFNPDRQSVAQNVAVGIGDWAHQLSANKQTFVDAWTQRPEFRQAYDGLSNAAFVDALITHAGRGFNGDRNGLVGALDSGTGRAAVLLQVVQNEGFMRAKSNEMFVMMEYFGYLRRDPDEDGYRFWLNKLNQFGGNFERAEMVKAFISSTEYRQRFGQ